MATELDITNWQGVGVQEGLITVALPLLVITKTQALIHAAWLVALATGDDELFAEILAAVRAS